MSGRRTSNILRIMGIEQEKRNIIHDAKFKILKENILLLSSFSQGAKMNIHNPENIYEIITIDQTREEVQKYVDLYEKQVKEYDERLEELSLEKYRLQAKIFKMKQLAKE